MGALPRRSDGRSDSDIRKDGGGGGQRDRRLLNGTVRLLRAREEEETPEVETEKGGRVITSAVQREGGKEGGRERGRR